MTIPIDLKDIIILIGIGNGVILSLYLLFDQQKGLSNRLLAFLILGLAFNVCIYIVLKYKVYDEFPALHWMPFGLAYVLGPLLYIYTKAIITPAFKLSKAHYWQFSLILLDYPHSIYHLIYGRDVFHYNLHYVLDKFALFAVISNSVYLWMTYKLVQLYNKQLPTYISNTESVRLKWLGDTIVMWFALLIIVLIYGTIDFIIDLDFKSAYYTNMIFTISVVWLGLKGIKQGKVSVEAPKSVSLNLDTIENEKIISELQELMVTQKLYLYPDLTLRNVEDKMGWTSKEISSAINNVLNKNFYHFVNEYRVEEFKRKVVDSRNSHLTLLGIAQECGFNSKATFNRVFKEKTGLSPREFVNQNKSQ